MNNRFIYLHKNYHKHMIQNQHAAYMVGGIAVSMFFLFFWVLTASALVLRSGNWEVKGFGTFFLYLSKAIFNFSSVFPKATSFISST